MLDLDEQWQKEGITQAFSAETHISNLFPKMAKMLNIEQFQKCNTPMDANCHPELDTTDFVDIAAVSQCKSMLGSLNWVNTLGRFGIAHALNTMSRCTMASRIGHFKAMKRIFGHLRTHQDGRILLDTGDAPIRETAVVSTGHNWAEFHPDAREDIPVNVPSPKGNLAMLTCHVDADHAMDQLTGKSVTGIVLSMNNTPIAAVSKRQKTVETSAFGSEMIAARIAVELLIAWRIMLRQLPLNVEEQSWLVGDNMSVIVNTTLPSSNLKKKHLACNHHKFRESIAGGFIIFGHVDSKDNLADICTKPLDTAAFDKLMRECLFGKPKSLELATKTPEGNWEIIGLLIEGE